MEDTGNQNVACLLPVKDNMLALFHAPQARANFITLATEGGIIGENLATIFKLADIATGLDLAPSANRINVDVEQIGFGTKRETELAHGANAASRQFGFLTDALENIALGNAADVALIDGDSQHGDLSLVLLFHDEALVQVLAA